ncbi:MAG: exodeoxyribonuclease VII small subunit [Muribaculaceae bacterium]|nr:exodeoxyribonuclease VII small subunit [Muribaculaceae bacterium]
MEIKSYKEAVEELDSIVKQMQSPDCDIDRLSEFTSRALTLLKYCKEKLLKTEEDVKRTLEEFS